MKRLLLVTQRSLEYGGGGSIRWRYFAEHLPEHGWEVHTVSARPNPTADDFATTAGAARLNATRAAVMGRVGAVTRPAFNHLLGIQPEAFAPSALWAITGRRAIRRAIAEHRPDVVVATSPPVASHLALAGLAPKLDVPLVFEMRDNWAGNQYYDAGGTALKRIERRLLQPASAIVVVTPPMADVVLRAHPSLNGKVHVLQNGFDPQIVHHRGERRPSPEEVRLVYAGALYGQRSPEALVTAMRRAPGRYRLTLAGPGVEALSPEPDVEIRPPMSWDSAIKLQARADIGVVLHSGDPTAQPGKLFELLALGRPVLALVRAGDATDKLLRGLGQGGGCALHDDVDSIATALRRLATDPPPPVPLNQLAPWSRASVAEEYARLFTDLTR